jgi:hypothetical protein
MYEKFFTRWSTIYMVFSLFLFVQNIFLCHENSWHIFNMASIKSIVSPWCYILKHCHHFMGIHGLTSHGIPKVQYPRLAMLSYTPNGDLRNGMKWMRLRTCTPPSGPQQPLLRTTPSSNNHFIVLKCNHHMFLVLKNMSKPKVANGRKPFPPSFVSGSVRRRRKAMLINNTSLDNVSRVCWVHLLVFWEVFDGMFGRFSILPSEKKWYFQWIGCNLTYVQPHNVLYFAGIEQPAIHFLYHSKGWHQIWVTGDDHPQSQWGISIAKLYFRVPPMVWSDSDYKLACWTRSVVPQSPLRQGEIPREYLDGPWD